MHILPKAKVARINALFLEGKSLRQVVQATGHSRKTCARYRPKGIVCGCGKPVEHRGWCKVRFRQSKRRQEVLAEMGKVGKKRGLRGPYRKRYQEPIPIKDPMQEARRDLMKAWFGSEKHDHTLEMEALARIRKILHDRNTVRTNQERGADHND